MLLNAVPDHQARDPSLTPGVGGLHWVRRDIDSISLSPVLSILELTFKTSIDVRDVSKPSGKLWSATLEYLLTLPGLEALFWGRSLESSSSVYLLLQWDSFVGWQTFQRSFGIGLVVELLASPPFNRSLSLRVDLLSVGTSYPDLYQDVITFPLSPRISAEERQTVKDEMGKPLSAVIGTSGADAWLQWLELDVPRNPRSIVAPDVAAEQKQVLVVLATWKVLPDARIAADLLPLDFLAGAVTKVTICLIEEKPRIPSNTTFRQNTEALFKLPPHRQYGQDSELFRQKDVIAARSKSKEQESLRAFPTPYGTYNPMGYLNQYSPLNEVKPHNPSSHKRFYMVVEVCWLQFKPGYMSFNSSDQDGSAMKEFLDLGAEIERDSECEGVSWGSEEGSPDALVMLISKSSKKKKRRRTKEFDLSPL